MFETLSFLQDHAAEDPGPLARALAASDRDDRAAEAADKADAEAKRAAAMDRAEGLALANRQLGDPLGEIQRAQAVIASARDEEADLVAKLATVRARRERAEHNAEFFATRMQAAHDSVSRMATETVTGGDDLLAGAKAAHRAYVQASRAAWQAAQAGAGTARPFARHGGAAVRAEGVTCKGCLDAGATPEESFLLHADPSPAPVPDGWQAPTEYCRDCYGELPGECKCSTAAGRYQPVSAGGQTRLYDKRYREMVR